MPDYYNRRVMQIKRPKSNQPIPKHAKRVFKGVVFDTYQWKQKLFDGSYATFEKIKRADSAGVIPVADNKKIILAEQVLPGHKPFIGILGGRIDEGESPLQAAKRELLEESGCVAEKYILWDAVQLFPTIDWAAYTFIAKGIKRVQEVSLDAGEKIKLKKVSFDEFVDLMTSEKCRDIDLALKLFRLQKNPKEFEKTRKLFVG